MVVPILAILFHFRTGSLDKVFWLALMHLLKFSCGRCWANFVGCDDQCSSGYVYSTLTHTLGI